MSDLRYSVDTKLPLEAVKKEALTQFVEKLGLNVTNDEEDSLCLEGGGGHITMTFCPGPRTSVEIDTQEWDVAVREFMQRIRK